MRIQFTDNNNTYTIETIKSFAKYLASKISDGTAKPGKTKFIADFALTSYDEDCEITIPEVLSDVERDGGFYGVKELGEIGFNSTNRQFAFDYYGGQHLRIFDFDEGFMGKDDAEWKINEILTDIFDVSENNWLLLIQWNKDECLVDDEKKAEAESTKKIEDEAVKNFAEMLESKIEGAVGAGYNGIGKEDLDDAVYEYINWDKKYTKEYEENRPTTEPERKNYYVEFYDKDRSEVIMQSTWMTEENARRWFQSNFDFTDYNHIAVNLIKADGDEDNYDTIFIEKLF